MEVEKRFAVERTCFFCGTWQGQKKARLAGGGGWVPLCSCRNGWLWLICLTSRTLLLSCDAPLACLKAKWPSSVGSPPKSGQLFGFLRGGGGAETRRTAKATHSWTSVGKRLSPIPTKGHQRIQELCSKPTRHRRNHKKTQETSSTMLPKLTQPTPGISQNINLGHCAKNAIPHPSPSWSIVQPPAVGPFFSQLQPPPPLPNPWKLPPPPTTYHTPHSPTPPTPQPPAPSPPRLRKPSPSSAAPIGPQDSPAARNSASSAGSPGR